MLFSKWWSHSGFQWSISWSGIITIMYQMMSSFGGVNTEHKTCSLAGTRVLSEPRCDTKILVACGPSEWHWLYGKRNNKFTRESSVTRMRLHHQCLWTIGHSLISSWAVRIAGCKKQQDVVLTGLNLGWKHLPFYVQGCATRLPAASSLLLGCNVVWQGFFPLENSEGLGFLAHSWRSFSDTSTGALVELKQRMSNSPSVTA